MRDFRDLLVWQKAHRLTLDVYRATKSFPAEERFGLTAQLRRSAASVPTNIAEGCGRDGKRDHRKLTAEGQLLTARRQDRLSDQHCPLPRRSQTAPGG